jgi:hypothetical protein
MLNSCQLPKIHGALLNWLVAASNSFWMSHNRCLTFVLVFCPRQNRWSFELPQQICMYAETNWSRKDIPPLAPGTALAGSFQSRLSAAGAATSLPAFSGIHFLHVPDPEHLILQAYVRTNQEEEPVSIDPGDLMVDYPNIIERALQRHMTSSE